MSFDQDPSEQANISGADLAIMCAEMAQLRTELAKVELQRDTYYSAWSEIRAQAVPDVDWLANVIRSIDGNHDKGAGAIADGIVAAMRKGAP